MKAAPFFILICITGFCLLAFFSSAAPTIQITNLPPFGSFNNISGVVLNADPATNRVALFIYVPNAGWYSKPTCAQPLTTIQPNGSWTANITTADSDTNATEIAALLVSSNYNQPCLEGPTGLPTNVLQQAEASVYADRVNPATRQFTFSDYQWWVKSGAGPLGPGPNYFSDSTNNVWVDASGQLHLRITNRSNLWKCVEIISDRSFGYGQYRFTVQAPVNDFDPNVVLAMFTWSDDTAYVDREMDVELSRWNNPADTNDAQFVVQPAGPGQLQRFSVPEGVTNSTFSFIWQSDQVDYEGLTGNFAAPPADTNVLKTWSCALGVPPPGGENLHLNFWLVQGNPPNNHQEVEAVISQFEFVPLGSPQPAQLSGLNPLNGGAAQLNVSGQADWHYDIYGSSNLLNWQEINRVLATNNVFQFVDPNAGKAGLRFYRALTEP